MNPLEFALLADENIHPTVIAYLSDLNHNIKTAREENLNGKSDLTILRHAFQTARVILTHDSDFGRLIMMQEEPFVGIIYLRPGHILPEFTIETLKTISSHSLNLAPPFIVVAEHTGQIVRIRVRQQ